MCRTWRLTTLMLGESSRIFSCGHTAAALRTDRLRRKRVVAGQTEEAATEHTTVRVGLPQGNSRLCHQYSFFPWMRKGPGQKPALTRTTLASFSSGQSQVAAWNSAIELDCRQSGFLCILCIAEGEWVMVKHKLFPPDSVLPVCSAGGAWGGRGAF